MARLLKSTEIEEKLESLPGWEVHGDRIRKVFQMDDFVSAAEALEEVVPLAEEMNHHPDLAIRNYNRLEIELTTHDEGGITGLDFSLAKKIEEELG